MKKIGIVPNLDKDADLALTKTVLGCVLDFGCIPQLSEKVVELLGVSNYQTPEEKLFSESSFIIVLGGDGTLLSVARKAALYDTPVLGINLGTLGFLTDVEVSEAKQVIGKVIAGEFKTEKRMMLEAKIRTQEDQDSHIALNDICITRGVFSRMVDLRIYVNNQYLDSYRADGIIVSTPTGSTAYNLSAGGPILKPDTEMVAITPICPHTLHSRPAVVSSLDIIKLKVEETLHTDIQLSIDGQRGIPLYTGDLVEIKRSRYQTTIIKTNNYSFYDILRKKMSGLRK